jgi:hypothetical protein
VVVMVVVVVVMMMVVMMVVLHLADRCGLLGLGGLQPEQGEGVRDRL